MPRLNPPSSTAVVEVADALVEPYVDQGWTVVADKKAVEAPKRKPGRPKKSE